jgi:polyhydroxybutyrate depolymerase
LTVNDAKRTYRLHLPPGGAVKPLPLVVSIHGAAADGLIQEVMTGLSPLADKEGFAVVYPDGLSRFWRVNSDAELDFFKALLDELVKEKVAEPRRIYVCGMSNGGFMTAKLGVELGDRIAAIAPVAGTAFGKNGDKVKRPVPVLYIHGDKDTFVNIEGRRVYQSADDFVAWWAGQNVCDKPINKQLPDDKDDGCAVEVITHAGKAPVLYYKIKGGGHTWPGGSPLQPERLLGKTCTEFNASEAIWQFFKQYELPEKK